MCKKYVVVNKLFLGQRELGYELWTGKEVIEMTSKSIKDSIKAGDEIYGLTIGKNGGLELDRESFYMTNLMEKRHIGNLTPMYETDSKANIFYLVTGSHKEGDKIFYEMISSRFERLDVTKEKLSIMYEMGLINGGVKMENGEPVLPQMGKKEQPEKKETVTEEKEKTAEVKKEPAEKKETTGDKKEADKKKGETAKNKETAAAEKKLGSAPAKTEK